MQIYEILLYLCRTEFSFLLADHVPSSYFSITLEIAVCIEHLMCYLQIQVGLFGICNGMISFPRPVNIAVTWAAMAIVSDSGQRLQNIFVSIFVLFRHSSSHFPIACSLTDFLKVLRGIL